MEKIYYPNVWCKFLIEAKVEEYRVEFKCYKMCSAKNLNEETGEIFGIEYERRVNDEYDIILGERTENYKEAQVYLSGYVKWEGCSNFKFDVQDYIRLHFCSKEDAEGVGKLLGKLYNIAKELLVNYEGD